MELVILNLLRSEYTWFWFHYFPVKLCPEMFMAIELLNFRLDGIRSHGSEIDNAGTYLYGPKHYI